MKKWIRIIAMSKTLSEVKRELGSKDALQFAGKKNYTDFAFIFSK